ncbi:MAG TPA: MATE family efflux transporter [Bacillota bacterium]|nr:MATE family efflux transporter [Bacillota bacterium]
MALTLPVIAEQTFITTMGVINAILSSHIGKEVAAAIGMIDSINNIFITFFSALAIGSTVVVAHYKGQENVKNVKAASKQSFYITLLIGLVLSLLMGLLRKPLLLCLYGTAESSVLANADAYFQITLFTYPLIAVTSVICGVLRGAGDTKTPAKAIIFMNLLNVVFSYLLIYGLQWNTPGGSFGLPGFGIRGAAWGIALARTCGALILTGVLFKNLNINNLKKVFSFKPNLEILKSIFNIGLPASVESLLFSTGKLISQTFMVSMGTAALAANYIGFSIQTLMTIPGSALGVTATTLVGQTLGKSDCSGARKLLASILKLGTALMLVLNVIVCVPLAEFLASLYNKDPEIIRLSALIIRLSVLFYPVWALSFILPAGLKGAGDTRYTLKVSIFSMWTVRVILGYVLGVTLHMGLVGIWLGMFLDWIIRGTWFYLRFKGDKWLNHTIIKKC